MLAFVFAAAAHTTLAAGLAERIATVKPAVVAVGTYQKSRSPAFRPMGTGFAVAGGRFIATNAHVLPATLDAEQREQWVAVSAASQGGTLHTLEKAASDPERDLVLLRVLGAPLPALTLGNSDSVREGQEVAFTGFPLVGTLGLYPATHRGIVAAISPIVIPQASAQQLTPQAIQRVREGGFSLFQLDATAYPGSSGSPVYDPDTGAVLAVINMVWVKGSKEAAVTAPSGISYAIPARYLQRLIDQVDR